MSEQLNQREKSADENRETPLVLSDTTKPTDVEHIFKLQQDQNAKLRDQHRAEMETKRQELRRKDEEIEKLKQERNQLEFAVEDQKIQFAFKQLMLKKDVEANRVRQEQEKQLWEEKLEQSALRTEDLELRIKRRDQEVFDLKSVVHRINSELKMSQDKVENLTEEIKLLQDEKIAQEMEFKVEMDGLKDKFAMELKEKDALFEVTANDQLANSEKLKKCVLELEQTVEKLTENMKKMEHENNGLEWDLIMAKSYGKAYREDYEESRGKVVSLMVKLDKVTRQNEKEKSRPALNNSADETHDEPTLSGDEEEAHAKKRKLK